MNSNTKIIILIAAIVAIFAFALGSFTVVEPNEVAVVKTAGKISGTIPRGNGYTFKVPLIQSVTTIELSPQKEDFTYTVGDELFGQLLQVQHEDFLESGHRKVFNL